MLYHLHRGINPYIRDTHFHQLLFRLYYMRYGFSIAFSKCFIRFGRVDGSNGKIHLAVKKITVLLKGKGGSAYGDDSSASALGYHGIKR